MQITIIICQYLQLVKDTKSIKCHMYGNLTKETAISNNSMPSHLLSISMTISCTKKTTEY